MKESKTTAAIAIGWTLLAAALLALVVAGGIDISAVRDFRADVAVRDSFPPERLPPFRYLDHSPWVLWIPSDLFVADSLREGRLPLWDRLQGGGFSPVVAFYLGVFHPVRWMGALFPRAAVPNVIIIVALYAAALGALFLARDCGLGNRASAVAAALFVVSPQLVSHVHFSGSILPFAHLPWVVLVARRAAATRAPGWFAALAVVVASLLTSGHPSIALAVLVGAAAFVIAGPGWRSLAIPAAATAAGAMLAAVAFMPVIVALPDLWTYKTATAEGVSYESLGLVEWLQTLGSVVWDTQRGACCIDGSRYFRHVGALPLLLIGAGVAASRREAEGRRLAWLLLVWFLLVVPGPWMAPLRFVPPFSMMKPWYHSGVLALLVGLVAAIGFERFRGETRHGLVALLGAVIAAGAVALYTMRAYSLFAPERSAPIAGGRIVDVLRRETSLFRITGLRGQVHIGNVSRLTGIEDARMTGPFFSSRYRVWWKLVDPEIEKRSFPTTRVTDRLDSPLVGDFNVKYVLQARRPSVGTFYTRHESRPDIALSPYLSDARFPLVIRTESAELRRNAVGFRPRAHFAERAVRVTTREEAERLLAADRQLAARAAVAEMPESSFRAIPPAARGQVSLSYPNDARVAIITDSPTGGLVVLHDTYSPGWRATIDGVEAKIFPVNVLSRGVIVPPGRHRIEMSYRPPGLAAGAAMSLLAAAGLAAFAGLRVRKRGRT